VATDTHEMVLIHRFIRREIGLLPELVLHAPPGNGARTRLIAQHGLELLDTIHVHHDGEDRLLWPLLLSRAALEASVIERMQGQHADVDAGTTQVRGLLVQWQGGGDADVAAALARAVEKLNTTLSAHLDEEEGRILPLAAAHLSPSEWAGLGQHSARHTPRKRLLRLLGQVLEDADETERRDFLRNLPPPPKILWRLVGHRQYATYVQRVRSDVA
jgi:hypothetical protein